MANSQPTKRSRRFSPSIVVHEGRLDRGGACRSDNILTYTAENYPSLVGPVEKRVRAVIARIGRWPKSAHIVEQLPEARVVPLLRYPYRIFYRVHEGQVEILYIHHAARLEPDA